MYREPFLDVDLLRRWSAVNSTGLIAAFSSVVTDRPAGDAFDTPLVATDRGGSAQPVPPTDG